MFLQCLDRYRFPFLRHRINSKSQILKFKFQNFVSWKTTSKNLNWYRKPLCSGVPLYNCASCTVDISEVIQLMAYYTRLLVSRRVRIHFILSSQSITFKNRVCRSFLVSPQSRASWDTPIRLPSIIYIFLPKIVFIVKC